MGGGETGDVLADVPDAVGVRAGDQLVGVGGAGRVVDDDELEVRVVLDEERVEGAGELLGPLAGGDDDGGTGRGERVGGVPRAAARRSASVPGFVAPVSRGRARAASTSAGSSPAATVPTTVAAGRPRSRTSA